MDLELTTQKLSLSIEKLKTWRDEMKSSHEDRSNEFLMLMEVMLQCVTYLFIIKAICDKGTEYIQNNIDAISETERQANEYIQLVESV